MSWFRRVMGLDGFDVALQAAITGVLIFWIAATNREQDAIIGNSVVVTASLVVLGIRRAIALRNAERSIAPAMVEDRIAELEARVAELEAERDRVVMIEERLDFTERLLARRDVKELAP